MQFLVDHGNTGGDGVGGVVEKHVLAIDAKMAAARQVSAAERFQQRALAGAVFAEQGVYAAGADGEAYVLQRPHARIRLGDGAEFQRSAAGEGAPVIKCGR